MEATLSSKNQAIIPKRVREHLHLKPGDKFKFFMLSDGTVVVLPKGPITALKGTLPKLPEPLSVEKMNAAIMAEAPKRSRR